MRFTWLTYLKAISRAWNDELSALDLNFQFPSPIALNRVLRAHKLRVRLESRSRREGGDHFTHGFVRWAVNSRG
jgi:hypothetical protein